MQHVGLKAPDAITIFHIVAAYRCCRGEGLRRNNDIACRHLRARDVVIARVDARLTICNVIIASYARTDTAQTGNGSLSLKRTGNCSIPLEIPAFVPVPLMLAQEGAPGSPEEPPLRALPACACAIAGGADASTAALT